MCNQEQMRSFILAWVCTYHLQGKWALPSLSLNVLLPSSTNIVIVKCLSSPMQRSWDCKSGSTGWCAILVPSTCPDLQLVALDLPHRKPIRCVTVKLLKPYECSIQELQKDTCTMCLPKRGLEFSTWFINLVCWRCHTWRKRNVCPHNKQLNILSNTSSAVLFSKVSQRIAADNSKSTTPKIDFQKIIWWKRHLLSDWRNRDSLRCFTSANTTGSWHLMYCCNV